MTNTKKGDNSITRLRNQLFGGRKNAPVSRITNDNIEEHRENILAKGRKFKYPAQYSKKRLITTTIVVVVVAITLFGLWLNGSLYKQQQTGDFYYSVTKILPLNVASVDGYPVRYQNYLRRLRADVHYYLNREQRSFDSDEGQKELDYHKRKNLAVAEKAAYVQHLAKQNNITISNNEVNDKVKMMREADGATEEELSNTLKSYYGWTLDDFRSTVYDQLLEQRVSYEIDSQAKAKINALADQLKKGADFTTLAKQHSDDALTKGSGGLVKAKTTDRDPTGVVGEAKGLAVGQLSSVKQVQLSNENYYYIVKLISKQNDDISYSIITVKLSKLNDSFATLQKENKINEYISVPPESSFNR